ncbi:hypothetical protein MJO28_016080 [Puccinia striiformis f. sp. tritici]|uniref:Uncharacterized protein n=1 Tax=Puccinia striiformis f. sp. tritici TaxID=168172 RepID=A0ACC0DQJ8_9BASI|nr:hypothetical protein MJO29_015315 [Puccinia striiformis f. sp. tritici]KAI7937181.1 hypothetical protein MJO28_016080 [Puccinia striiformis f. sp. tritici]
MKQRGAIDHTRVPSYVAKHKPSKYPLWILLLFPIPSILHNFAFKSSSSTNHAHSALKSSFETLQTLFQPTYVTLSTLQPSPVLNSVNMRSFAILAALVMAVSQVTANAEKSHAPASSPADGPAPPPAGGPHPPPPAGSHPGPAGPPVPMAGDMSSGECMCPPPPACPAMGAIAPGPNSVIPINGTMPNNATMPNNGTMSNNGTMPNNGTTSDDDEDTDSESAAASISREGAMVTSLLAITLAAIAL